MNNKALTLIELLAVIAILGLMSVIISPNVYKSIDNNKKMQYIIDAKEMIKKAKHRFRLKKYEDLFIKNNNCYEISMKDLGYENKKTKDNTYYDTVNSKVKICYEDESYTYYVKTISKRGVYNNGYVMESELSIKNINEINY